MGNRQNKVVRDISLVIFIGVIGMLLSLGLITFKSFIGNRESIYEYGKTLGFTEYQVDKLLEGAKKRANDPSWK